MVLQSPTQHWHEQTELETSSEVTHPVHTALLPGLGTAPDKYENAWKEYREQEKCWDCFLAFQSRKRRKIMRLFLSRNGN